MIKTLRNEGLPHQFAFTAGIGHTYPEDLDVNIDQAVDYIYHTGIIKQ